MEKPRKPQIGLIHLELIAESNFAEFATALRADGLDLRIQSRPDPGPYAGVEWLIPTAVVVYIGKAYFETFLKEAAKDHYSVLKSALSKLSAKFIGKGAPQGRVVFTKGKAESEIPSYSIFYSVVSDLGDSLTIKLLLQNDFSAELCNEAQGEFLEFLLAVQNDSLDINSVKGLAQATPIGRTLLLAYDPGSKALEVVDPLAGKKVAGA